MVEVEEGREREIVKEFYRETNSVGDEGLERR